MTAGGIVKMKFCEQLGKYIEQLSCTAKELCELSGISPSTFSRYRSGERIPEIDTVAFDGLCHSLKSVAKPVKRHSVYLRYSLSASVSAKC